MHLKYLDGIRGWAALFVALHHAWQFVVTSPGAAYPGWFRLTTIFKFGQYSVPVFIVLSGYCLALPVASLAEPRLSGGVAGFMRRRSRRILPPYYAALVLSLVLVLFSPRLQLPTQSQWDIAQPALAAPSLISHFLLVHNWFESLTWTINPPLWSVALEYQIYLVFALALVPVWRRFGLGASLALAVVISAIPALLGYGFVMPWFVGLFAAGALAAVINFSSQVGEAWRGHRRWEWLSAAAALGVVVCTVLERQLAPPAALVHSLIGVATAAFLVASTSRMQRGLGATLILRGLEHAVSAGLGRMSYSLYLIHFPPLALLYLVLVDLGLSPVTQFMVLATLGTGALVAVTYAFHRAFELPFMRPSGGGARSEPALSPQA